MTSTEDGSKRKNVRKFKYVAKKFKQNELQAGMKGVLLTCNGSEKYCIREAYNLLNEYSDNLYGPEIKPSSEVNACIEDQLEEEMNALKSKKERRFQQVSTKVKNILFIKADVPDIIKLIHTIFEDIKSSKQKKTRNIFKLLPVQATCKCSPVEFKKTLSTVIKEQYPNLDESAVTYKVECKVRHNSGAHASDFFMYTQEVIGQIQKNWIPTLSDFDIIISIYILQTICCVGILKSYEDFKKYNLAEIVPIQSTHEDLNLRKDDKSSVETTSENLPTSVENEKCVQLPLLVNDDDIDIL